MNQAKLARDTEGRGSTYLRHEGIERASEAKGVTKIQHGTSGYGPRLPTWALQQVGSLYEPSQAVIVRCVN
jgi:hypothetical protein